MPCTRRQLVVDGPLAALGAFAAARVAAQAQPSAATPPAAPTMTAPPASPAPAPPTPVWTELRGGVGTFTAAGGTIGAYLGPESLVVVDTQVPDGAKLFLEALRQRTPRPIDVLLNTHHHGDHTGGNGILRSSAVTIVAHDQVPLLQARASAEQNNAPFTPPDTTFSDAWRRDFGSELVAARYFGPAHTGGDIVIHFEKAAVVHLGDLVFNRLFPVIDLKGGGVIRRWAERMEEIAKIYGEGPIYIFGHARPDWPVTGKKADLLYHRDYLTALLDYARKGLAAGKPVDELAAAAGLPAFPDHVGRGTRAVFSANVRAACEELGGR